MCLGTVAQVVELHRDGRAVVEHGGRREEVLAMTVADDDIQPGDWVVVHSGFALERISEAQAIDALAIRATEPPPTDPHATNPHTTNPHTTEHPTTHGASTAPQHKEVAP